MLEKLEKKFGKYAIHNLIYYILGAYVIGYVLYLAKPEWYEYIVLYPSLVMKGQVWRLFTWVCTVPQALNIFLIFMFLFYFFIGKSLEQTLGAFQYNVYIFSGWFFTTLGVMAVYWISSAINGVSGAISISASTYYLNLTSFLAFAVIFPDTRVFFFGIIPIKMKILAWIDGIYLGLQVVSGLIVALTSDNVVSQALQLYYGYPPSSFEVAIMRQASISLVVTIMISMLNFIIFFLAGAKKRADSRKRYRDFSRKAEQGRRDAQNRQQTDQSTETSRESMPFGRGTFGQARGTYQADSSREQSRKRYRADQSDALVHRCTICGRTNIENPDLMFRYCSKCSGSHEYCQEHLFTHVHLKE